MKIKICGITNLEDAHNAVNAGADALGFLFAQLSPRYITPGAAREIIQTLPPFVTPVGIFVNRKRDEISDIVAITGIRCIQFHGDETPMEMIGYPIPVYRAFRLRSEDELKILERFPGRTFLLDMHQERINGGGKVHDWSIPLAAKAYGRIILSGNFSPSNVRDVVRSVSPYAIDVNGGVESAPGKKDEAKLNELFAVLRTMKEHLC